MDVAPLIASAPGKLVLCGEYAVLEGAPAVVLAVNRRARVRLSASDDADWHIDAADIGIHDARCRFDAAGRLQCVQLNATDRASLALLAAVLESFARQCETHPARIVLETQAFFSEDHGHSKLGLGSSAALAVALSGAVCAYAHGDVPELADVRRAHNQAQGGRGSGLDVATSLHGGVLTYRLNDGCAQTAASVWPERLEMCCVWSGVSARTGALLQQMATWRVHHETAFMALMRDMGVVAEHAARAMADGNVATLIDALAAYGDLLDGLGKSSGLDIVCTEHRAISALARASGVVYKTSGAGGGDVGVAVSDDAERLRRFRQQVSAAGFVPLDLAPDPCGLRLESTEQDTR